MSNPQNGPRDVVEGGPERAPDGADEPEQGTRRPEKQDDEKKGAPPQQGDVPPWYQPESGQPGTSR